MKVIGNVSKTIDKYFEYTNKHRKTIENENDSHFHDCRANNRKEGTKYIIIELNKLPIHKELRKLTLDDVMMDFDAMSLFPSALWDENSVYPKKETAYAFKPHLNKTYVDAYNNQTLNQDGNEFAILRIKY